MRRRGLAVLFAAAALVPAARAGADPGERVAFEWVREAGAEDCADGEALARRVEERLGRTVFVERATTIVTGHVTRARTAPRWRATLALASGTESSGDREITSNAPTCRPLESAVVLFLALLLDEHTATASEPAPPPPPEPPHAAAVAPAASPIAPPANSPRRVSSGASSTAASATLRTRERVAGRWTAGVAVGPVATLGVLPDLAPGVRVTARLSSPWPIALQVSGAALAEQIIPTDAERVSLSAQVLAVELCPRLERGRLSVGACASLEALRIHKEGVGTENRVVGHAGAGTWLSVQVWRWLSAGAALRASVPFFRQVVARRDNGEEIHRISAISGTIEVHAAVQFP